jgi:hypothetical protein
MKIYNELESLGFFEWLKEKGFGSGFTPIILDEQPIDSIERSGYNAIAFRWFREEHNLYPSINIYNDKWLCIIKSIVSNEEHISGYVIDTINKGYPIFKTHEEAELECLVKLIEIVKNKQ